MNKRLIAFIILIITILGNSCFIIADLKKNESKTIKIPDYNMSRFIYTDEIGNRAGYSYEIFQEIAKCS